MTNGANVFEGKIALAKRNIEHGMKPGKMMAIISDGTIPITKTQALARRSRHFYPAKPRQWQGFAPILQRKLKAPA